MESIDLAHPHPRGDIMEKSSSRRGSPHRSTGLRQKAFVLVNESDDVLNLIISVPIPWLSGEEVESEELAQKADIPEAPRFPRNILQSLRSTLDKLDFGKHDIEQFYTSICHRINTKVLLFDGLYAIAKPETSGMPPMASSKKGLDSSAIHVHTTPVSRLMFDATKCADSIAIVSGTDVAVSSGNGPSVNQRASKVWGAVLSTQYFSPKSGIHRWAVKLDKCERGHVFIGVSTSQASVRTYVGGDKHGWGMIGTQALWHDRRKVCKMNKSRLMSMARCNSD